MSMDVSVIIPMYNAARFIEDTIKSVLAQPEVAEVLLIDDGSTDESVSICERFSDDPRIILLHHPDNKNHGVAATRNLGIAHAHMPIIAFLDADDTFLPNRFEITRQIFTKYPDAEGVHEVIGTYYHDALFKEQYLKRETTGHTGIRMVVRPKDLFRILATGKYGHSSLDGLTVRRNVFAEGLKLDPEFTMSEDMDFILRLAARHKIYSGDPSKPVALRGVHDSNSIFRNPHMLHFRRKYLEKCIRNEFYGSTDFLGALYIVSRYVGATEWFVPFHKLGKFSLPVKLIGVCGTLLLRPGTTFHLVKLFIGQHK
jgi:glycosyltransferase involved in cell wall biosynthesis